MLIPSESTMTNIRVYVFEQKHMKSYPEMVLWMHKVIGCIVLAQVVLPNGRTRYAEAMHKVCGSIPLEALCLHKVCTRSA